MSIHSGRRTSDVGARTAVVEQDERIVVGVDGSASSQAALRWAAQQAELTGSRLEAVMVDDPAPAMFFATGGYPAVSPVDTEAARRRSERDLRDTVAAVLGRPRADDVICVTVTDSSPARGLVRLSRDARMLVVGARRHNVLGVLLGSTGASCVRHAVTPVVVVPEADATE